METFDISKMINGWLIGNFTPSVLKTEDFEIAHHKHPANYTGPYHYHKVATEYNYIVSGEVWIYLYNDGRKSKQILTPGLGWIVRPGQYFETYFNKPTDLIVIKTPSLIGDKFNENH